MVSSNSAFMWSSGEVLRNTMQVCGIGREPNTICVGHVTSFLGQNQHLGSGWGYIMAVQPRNQKLNFELNHSDPAYCTCEPCYAAASMLLSGQIFEVPGRSEHSHLNSADERTMYVRLNAKDVF